jgi:hypothetical protein
VSFSAVPCVGSGLTMPTEDEELMARVLDVFRKKWL